MSLPTLNRKKLKEASFGRQADRFSVHVGASVKREETTEGSAEEQSDEVRSFPL